MPTIKVEEVTRREVEVEVQFPVYSQHDLMPDDFDSVEFRRWDADGTLWTIRRIKYPRWRGGHRQWEVSRGWRRADGFEVVTEQEKSILGLGEHACTADEFAEVLREAREFLAGIDGIKGA